MTRESTAHLRPWGFAFRTTVLPVVVGLGLAFALIVLAQMPQACNGVQVCAPLGTRSSAAGLWIVLIMATTIAVSMLRLTKWRTAARSGLVILVLLGLAGTAATLFATGF
jgi:hypothetical protein